MISAAVSFGMVLLLFASGRIYEGAKRFLMFIVDIFLKILNLFGIQINTKERRIKTSRKFKQTFRDIKIVKRSKENNKIKPSINLMALCLLVFSITVVVINLEIVSGNFITVWLFQHNPFTMLIKTQESMDVTLTAVLFSIIAFSISKLVSQWKETAKFRKAKREMRKREQVLCKMSAKELLDAAKMKDADGYSRLMKSDNNTDNSETAQKKHKREKTKKVKQKKEKKQKLVKEAKTESNAKNF